MNFIVKCFDFTICLHHFLFFCLFSCAILIASMYTKSRSTGKAGANFYLEKLRSRQNESKRRIQ
ncbi:hypothetical protein CLOSTMETH_01594 [[Clostridium] methylpentosum DSM 5476]|uniref:Uncharacterized protein n=1 Tax=[Clostridium] methylpentosum DSM 5476 TaxID=537013 RepID=C0ECM3_9FIRM|nr:hypothetical protein CLOSTMETH_01594 [[Clostridium] methylpentosum DSM 5476]